VSASSELKSKQAAASEMSVDVHGITWLYILEDRTVHSHHCENLISSINTKIVVLPNM
jgi:hypothetical protein